MKNEKVIEVKPIVINTVTITIAGDSDLILNKIDAWTERLLKDKQTGKPKTTETPNEWLIKATKIHWIRPFEGEYNEANFYENLKKNAACISAFGLKKSFGETVVRTGLDKYKTSFDASVNVLGENNLVPIKFAEHHIDEKLISPGRGKPPVLSTQNRFTGWSADITIQYLDNGKFSLEQIIQIVGLAGFSMGIGSGRSSGYGRYHVQGVTK